MKRDSNGKGMVLYEQVLQKNFQIIETFLNKFPVIFKKQDYFDQSIKKINDKLLKYDQQTDKIRQQMNMTATVLDKKIIHLKENSSRNSRSSMRMSQEMGSIEQRKNSIFRVSTAAKENKEQAALFSKQKMELLNQMDKKQQESNKRIEELQLSIFQMQQKMNFISVMNGKLDRGIDRLIDEKVDKVSFEKLELEYQKKFQEEITTLVEQKYKTIKNLIQKEVTTFEDSFKREMSTDLSDIKRELFKELQKKAEATKIKDEFKQIKTIIERMVEESVQSFASKEETKMVLLLFEKKFSKMELVMEEVLQTALKSNGEEESHRGIVFSIRKEKDGVIGSFGRKKRINEK